MSSNQQSMDEAGVRVGDASGEILVECDGRNNIPARVVSGVERSELADPSNRGREVCVVFEQGDPARPISVGVMEDRLETLASMVL